LKPTIILYIQFGILLSVIRYQKYDASLTKFKLIRTIARWSIFICEQ